MVGTNLGIALLLALSAGLAVMLWRKSIRVRAEQSEWLANHEAWTKQRATTTGAACEPAWPGVGNLLDETRRLKADQEKARTAWGSLDRRIERIERLLSGVESVASRLGSPAPGVRVSGLDRWETVLLASVNRWWAGGGADRQELIRLTASLGIETQWMALQDVEHSLQTISPDGPYRFVRSDRDGGWLWCSAPDGQTFLAVPADPAFFQTRNSLILVSRIFDGCQQAPERVRFRRAYRSCRLHAAGGKPDRYVVVTRGAIALENSADPGGPPVPPYESLRAEMPAAAVGEPTMAGVLQELLARLDRIAERHDPDIQRIERVVTDLRTRVTEIERTANQRLPAPTASAGPVSRDLGNATLTLARRVGVTPPLGPPNVAPRPATASSHSPESAGDLPAGWREVVRQAGLRLADSQMSPAEDYLERLAALRDSLAAFLRKQVSPLRADVRHAAFDGDSVCLHQVVLKRESSALQLDCVECGRRLANDYVFQALLSIEDLNGNAWLLLPPGPLLPTRFPRGYQMLVNQAPTISTTVVSVDRAARLKSTREDVNRWQLLCPMILKVSDRSDIQMSDPRQAAQT